MMKFEDYRQHGRSTPRIKLPGNPLWYFGEFEAYEEIHGKITQLAERMGLTVCRVYDDNAGAYALHPGTLIREEPLMVGSWIGVCRTELSAKVTNLLQQPMQGTIARVDEGSGEVAIKGLKRMQQVEEQIQREVDTTGMTVAIRPGTLPAQKLIRFMQNEIDIPGIEVMPRTPDEGPRNLIFSMGFPYHWSTARKSVNDLGLYRGLP